MSKQVTSLQLVEILSYLLSAGEKLILTNPRLVHFIAGLAHVTLPQDSSQELWLVGGRGGLVIAADTTGEGHITMYPSDQQTVTLTAPFAGGVIPEHEVLKEGPCDGLQTFI